MQGISLQGSHTSVYIYLLGPETTKINSELILYSIATLVNNINQYKNREMLYCNNYKNNLNDQMLQRVYGNILVKQKRKSLLSNMQYKR